MRFGGKFIVLCCMIILVLVFLFQVNAKAQGVEVEINIHGVNAGGTVWTYEKPSFKCVFIPESPEYAKGMPDDSVRFVIYKYFGPSIVDSIVVCSSGVVKTGFQKEKKNFGVPAGSDSVIFTFSWHPNPDSSAPPLVQVNYGCEVSGVYEFDYGSGSFFVSGTTENRFFVYPTWASNTTYLIPSAPLANNIIGTKSKPSFKYKLNVDTASYQMYSYARGVPDSSVRFVIYESATGDSTVVFDGKRTPQVLAGFEKKKDLGGPSGKDTLVIFTFSWHPNPDSSADPLVDGLHYFCRASGTYKFTGGGYSLFYPTKDSTTIFTVVSTAPEITVHPLGYTNSKGEFDFLVESYKGLFLLDTTNFFIDFYLVSLPNTSSEERNYIKTISADSKDMPKFGSAAVETVEVTPNNLNLLDGTALDIFIYNGETPDRMAYVDSADTTGAYPDSISCQDLVLNKCGLVFKRLIVDGISPQITMLDSTDKAWKFYIHDAGSGVDNSSVIVKENGEKVTSSAVVQYDPSTNILTYYPLKLGALFNLTVKDKVGNRSSYSRDVESGRLVVYDVHSFPNPFNPLKGEQAKIVINSNNQDMEVSAKVYDLAGKLVATLKQNEDEELLWNGRTDGGTLVANGAYLCYVSIKDTNELTVQNYVLKIAVVKK